MPGEKEYGWKAEPMRDERGFMTLEQVERVIDAAETDRDRMLLTLLARSGRRISEIIGEHGITPAHVDSDEGFIYFMILKKKERKRYPIPVDVETVRMLQEYIDDNFIQDDEKIFPISRQRAFQIVRSCGKRAGIEHVGSKRIHPHHFRHSFAVLLAKSIRNPAELRKVQDILKHSNIQITTSYLKFNQSDTKKLLDRVFNK